MEELEALTDRIASALQGGRVAFFCGAGISVNSGLPTANDIVDAVLSLLPANKATRKHISRADLPFESFMDILKNMVGIDELFKIFRLGKPNATHRFLAALLRRRLITTIGTTNFDTLIESALAEGGAVDGWSYATLCSTTDFSGCKWSDECSKLVKLHGSIPLPETVAISIREVASRILSGGRRQAIEHIFSKDSHDAVIVIGYSCSDIFDISPAIQSLSGTKAEIILVEHLPSNKPQREAEDISAAPMRNPFLNFSSGHRYYANTDEVIAEVCRKLDMVLPAISLDPPREHSEWRILASDWQNAVIGRYSEAALEMTLGVLLNQVGEPTKAFACFERSLSHARRCSDLHTEIMALVNLAGVMVALANHEDALAHLESAERLMKLMKGVRDDRLGLAIALGIARLRMAEDIGLALTLFESLAPQIKILKDPVEVAFLGDLGVCHLHLGSYDLALRFFGDSLDLAREIGDKHGEGLRLGNLGQLHSMKGLIFDAISCFQQARVISDQLGDFMASGVHSFNLATCYLAISIPNQARTELKLAVRLFRKVVPSNHRSVVQAQQLLESIWV